MILISALQKAVKKELVSFLFFDAQDDSLGWGEHKENQPMFIPPPCCSPAKSERLQYGSSEEPGSQLISWESAPNLPSQKQPTLLG